MVEKIQQITASSQKKDDEIKTVDDFNAAMQEKLKKAVVFEQNTGKNITFGELRDIKSFIEDYKNNPEMSKICEDYTKYIKTMLNVEKNENTRQEKGLSPSSEFTEADKEFAIQILLGDSSKNKYNPNAVLNQTSISYNIYSLFEDEKNGKGINPKFNQYDKNASVFNKQ
jgi:hypothetical protein